MKKLITILFAFVFIQYNQINAKQINASDMSYQCTDVKNVYKVTVKVYRDCTGENLCSGCSNAIPNGSTSGCTLLNAGFTTAIAGTENEFKGVIYGSFNLIAVTTVPNGYDVVQPQACLKQNSICTNCNTRTAGTYSPGIEVYTFEGLVDLNVVPVACCNIALSISINGRNTSLTNMIPENYYNECIINRCVSPCNSSPSYTYDNYDLVCAGVDNVYSISANDPDGDSMSYKLVSCMKDRGVPVTYVTPYSAQYPFSFFGAPNTNAAYPAGFHIDPMDGNIYFRPINYFNANFVVEITQWHLINGVITNVGVVNRDIQIQTISCLSNKVPVIAAYKDGVKQPNLNFYAQFGKQFCIDIVAQDQELLTNTPPVLADTTDLKWNNPGLYNPLLATATFTRNYILANRGIDGPKADSFKFCWTPPASAKRAQPHSFTITGTDRFCPNKAFATRGVNITVGEFALKTSTIENESFSIYPNPAKTSLFINLKNGFSHHPNIAIFDILGKEIYQFTLTNSEMEIDVSKLVNGIYFIKLSDENSVFTQKFIKE